MSSRAFSLVEVLAAIGVVAVGILAIFSCLSFGVKANRHAELATQAANLNREIIALIKVRGSNNFSSDPAGAHVRLTADPFQDDLVQYADSPFTRNVQIHPLGDAPSFEHDINSIKVTIYWQEASSQRQLVFETYDRE